MITILISLSAALQYATYMPPTLLFISLHHPPPLHRMIYSKNQFHHLHIFKFLSLTPFFHPPFKQFLNSRVCCRKRWNHRRCHSGVAWLFIKSLLHFPFRIICVCVYCWKSRVCYDFRSDDKYRHLCIKKDTSIYIFKKKSWIKILHLYFYSGKKFEKRTCRSTFFKSKRLIFWDRRSIYYTYIHIHITEVWIWNSEQKQDLEYGR